MTELKPSVRIEKIEFAAGLQTVNGRPHGIDWQPAYAVVVRFLRSDDADEFAEMARNWNRRAEPQE